VRLRKPKDKVAQHERMRATLRDMSVQDRDTEAGPDLVPIHEVVPWGHVRVENGVTPWA
jgi:hypothetical protein